RSGPEISRPQAGGPTSRLPRGSSLMRSSPRCVPALAVVCSLVSFAVTPARLSADEASPAAEKPNFVVIVADDLGWGDVGWHEGPYRTPHLDRLCREGLELDQHYVSPMCSPTRAAFLSGRYASR